MIISSDHLFVEDAFQKMTSIVFARIGFGTTENGPSKVSGTCLSTDLTRRALHQRHTGVWSSEASPG